MKLGGEEKRCCLMNRDSFCNKALLCSKCPHMSKFYQQELDKFFDKIEELKKKNNLEGKNEGSSSTKV